MTHMRKMMLAAVVLGAFGTASPALAQNVMQACGAKYQAAKTANKLPAGQTWMQFLAACRADMAKSATTTPAKPATIKAVATKAPRTPGQPSPAQKAMYERERQCGVKWRADKAAGKLAAGMKWPQYWSACNKTMK